MLPCTDPAVVIATPEAAVGSGTLKTEVARCDFSAASVVPLSGTPVALEAGTAVAVGSEAGVEGAVVGTGAAPVAEQAEVAAPAAAATEVVPALTAGSARCRWSRGRARRSPAAAQSAWPGTLRTATGGCSGTAAPGGRACMASARLAERLFAGWQISARKPSEPGAAFRRDPDAPQFVAPFPCSGSLNPQLPPAPRQPTTIPPSQTATTHS